MLITDQPGSELRSDDVIDEHKVAHLAAGHIAAVFTKQFHASFVLELVELVELLRVAMQAAVAVAVAAVAVSSSLFAIRIQVIIPPVLAEVVAAGELRPAQGPTVQPGALVLQGDG